MKIYKDGPCARCDKKNCSPCMNCKIPLCQPCAETGSICSRCIILKPNLVHCYAYWSITSARKSLKKWQESWSAEFTNLWSCYFQAKTSGGILAWLPKDVFRIIVQMACPRPPDRILGCLDRLSWEIEESLKKL